MTDRQRFDRFLLFGFLAVFQLLFFAFQLDTYHDRFSIDFPAFYTAGTIVSQGHGARLYDLDYQREIQATLIRRPQHFWPFYHAGFVAVFFVPLALLSYYTAYYTWIGINLLLIASLAFIPLPVLDGKWRPFRVLVALSFPPIVETLVLGQTSIVLLCLLLWSLSAWIHEKERKAGFLLGIGLIKFQHIPAFLAVLLFKKKNRMLTAFATATVLLALVWVSFAGGGVGAHLDFIRGLIARPKETDSYIGIYPYMMSNLRGVFALLDLGLPALAISSMAALIGLLWLFWRETPRGEAIYLPFAAAVVIGLLVSFHANYADRSLLLIPIMWQMESMLRGKKSLAGTVALVIFYLPIGDLSYLPFGLLTVCATLLLLVALFFGRTTEALYAAKGARP